MSIPTIEEFAADEKKRVKCTVCLSPHRAAIDDAQAKGLPATTIERWLKVHHPEDAAHAYTLNRHLREGHATAS